MKDETVCISLPIFTNFFLAEKLDSSYKSSSNEWCLSCSLGIQLQSLHKKRIGQNKQDLKGIMLTKNQNILSYRLECEDFFILKSLV